MVSQSTMQSAKRPSKEIKGLLYRSSHLNSRASWKLKTIVPQQKPKLRKDHCKEICGYGFCLMEWTLKGFTEDSLFLRELYLKRYHHLEVEGTWRGQNKKRHLDPQVSTSRKQAEKTSWLRTHITFNENGRMTNRPKPRAQRMKLRVIENYSQTSTWDLSKDLETFPWWDFGIAASYMLPSFSLCEQECL